MTDLPLPVYERPPGRLAEEALWTRARGVEILVPAADQVVTPYMRHRRDWDPTIVSAVLDCVTPQSTFVDVGAMVAYFSAVVAKSYPTAAVYAVEPSAANLRFASLNLDYYPNATLLSGGITDDPEARWELITDEVNRGNTRVAEVELPPHDLDDVLDPAGMPTTDAPGPDAPAAPMPQSAVDDGEATAGLDDEAFDSDRIPMATLRSLVESTGCDVVKVDVQGMESAVLASLDVATLDDRDLSVFCEISPDEWSSLDAIEQIISDFVGRGFDAYFVGEDQSYSAFSRERMSQRLSFESRWSDHFEVLLTRGRYADQITGRAR